MKRVADEHGSDLVVLLGTPDAESTQTLAQTVVASDPPTRARWPESGRDSPYSTCSSRKFAIRLPGDVYEAQVALMEMSLDRDAILAGLREARRAAATTCRALLDRRQCQRMTSVAPRHTPHAGIHAL